MKQLKFFSILCAFVCMFSGVSKATADAPWLQESKTLSAQPPGAISAVAAVNNTESIKFEVTRYECDAIGVIATIVNSTKTNTASVKSRDTEAFATETPGTVLYGKRFSCTNSKLIVTAHLPYYLSGRLSTGAICSPVSASTNSSYRIRGHDKDIGACISNTQVNYISQNYLGGGCYSNKSGPEKYWSYS